MKKTFRATCFALLFLFSSLPGLFGQSDNSPYFQVISESAGQGTFPLELNRAEVNIVGMIADVELHQVYTNNSEVPIEAVYVFPASTHAAVHGMEMVIGDRVIKAVVRKRKDAEKDYEKAKKKGKKAALLEQEQPNVFQMQVANILPGQRVEVRLSYSETIMVEKGTYEFVLPAVVGPMYTGNEARIEESTGQPARKGSQEWTHTPYLHEGQAPTYAFDVDMRVQAAVPIASITAPSHRVNIELEDPRRAHVRLHPNARSMGDREFILRYDLRSNVVESGLLTFEGEDENFFMLMTQPPARPEPEFTPPREYIFVLDVSGSMSGVPLETSKRMARELLNGLWPRDKFNIVLFAGGSKKFAAKPVKATRHNVLKAMAFLNAAKGGGGTELHAAMEEVLSSSGEKGRSRSIILCTDGYVSASVPTFELVRNGLGSANLFAFGIGSSVNRFLMEGLAHSGMGEAFIVTNQEEAAETADRFREYISTPVLTDIELDFGGAEVYDLAQSSFPDLMAERPVIVYGKYKGKPEGDVILRGNAGEKSVELRQSWAENPPNDVNKAIRYLWAREKIRQLGDYQQLSKNDERAKAVEDLGLKYGLLTEYTSFVAIDERPGENGGEPVRVVQPLPLPSGVSDLSISGGYGGSSGSGNLYIGNVFTPNSDSCNDRWEPQGLQGKQYSFKIYDRWGQVVFECKSNCNGWDGNNGMGVQVPAGTYIYIIEVNGNQITGTVSILR